MDVVKEGDDGRRKYYWIARDRPEWVLEKGLDVWAVRRRRISVTPDSAHGPHLQRPAQGGQGARQGGPSGFPAIASLSPTSLPCTDTPRPCAAPLMWFDKLTTNGQGSPAAFLTTNKIDYDRRYPGLRSTAIEQAAALTVARDNYGPLFPLAPALSTGQGMIGNRCLARRHSCPRAGIQKGAGRGWMPAGAGTTTLGRSHPAHVARQAQHERAERLRNAVRLVYVALFP